MPLRQSLMASLIVFGLLVSAGRASAQASAPAPVPPQASTTSQSNLLKPDDLKTIDKYLRNLFAWGPDFQLKLGTIVPSPSPEIYEIPIEVTANGQTDGGSVYVTKDAK